MGKTVDSARTGMTSLAGIVASAVFVLAGEGHALLAPGCQCGVISGYHKDTREHVTEETTEAARQIVGALRRQSEQNSNYLDRQVEASRRIADGEAQNEARLARSIIRAEAESGDYDPNPDYCLQLDSALQPRLPDRNLIGGLDGVTESATNWTIGNSPAVRENGVAMARWLSEERSRLRNAGGARDATTDWEFALESETLPIEQTEYRQALTRLIANTIDPFPSRPLFETDLQTPAGLAESVRRQTTEARNRAAISSISAVLQLAEPTIPAGPIRGIANRSRREFELPDLVSELQALEVRIAAYNEPSTDSLLVRHSKTERALLQDIIDLQAVNARLAYLRLVQESRNAVVFAAILGIMTDGTTASLSRN